MDAIIHAIIMQQVQVQVVPAEAAVDVFLIAKRQQTISVLQDAMPQVMLTAAGIQGNAGTGLPVRRTRSLPLAGMLLAGAIVAAVYGWLLHCFTNAYAPFLDSVVLAFSVLGQLLLMRRRYESWWCWLLVNAIAVPLYLTRGLTVTAILYAAFWINAVVALVRWRKLVQPL